MDIPRITTNSDRQCLVRVNYQGKRRMIERGRGREKRGRERGKKDKGEGVKGVIVARKKEERGKRKERREERAYETI